MAIWGFAREGRAALRFLRERDPGLAITVLDDADGAGDIDAPLISGRAAIAAAIGGFDVVVKSPGISLYDPLVVQVQAEGVRFTSLLNLWFADAPDMPDDLRHRHEGQEHDDGADRAHPARRRLERGGGGEYRRAGDGAAARRAGRRGHRGSSYQAADFAGRAISRC